MQIINFQDKLKNRNQRPILPKLTKATIIRQARINKLNQIIKPRIAVQPKQPTRKDIEVQTSFTKNDINNLEQENEILLYSNNVIEEKAVLCENQAFINGAIAFSNEINANYNAQVALNNLAAANYNAQVALNNGMLANYNAQVAQGNLMGFGIASAIAVNLSNENQRLKQELAEYQQLLKQLLEEKNQERTL